MGQYSPQFQVQEKKILLSITETLSIEVWKKKKKKKLVPVWFRVYCYSLNNLRYAEGTTLVAESEEEL